MRYVSLLALGLGLLLTLSAVASPAEEATPLCAVWERNATPVPQAAETTAFPEPPALTPADPAKKFCFWAIYDEYYDAYWNQCGFNNTCTGDRQTCNYTYRQTEIIPCCN